MLTREDMKNWIRQNLFFPSSSKINPSRTGSWLKIRNADIFNLMLSFLSFLPEGASSAEVIYCLLHDVSEQPKCDCGNHRLYNKSMMKYADFCSPSCDFAKKHVRAKMSETMLKRYGTEHALRIPEIQAKTKRTFQTKYGVDSPSKMSDYRSRTEETNKARYGYSHPTQRQEARKSQSLKRKEHIEKTYAGIYDSLRNKELLVDLHENKKQNLNQIADALGCGPTVVRKFMGFHSIEFKHHIHSSLEQAVFDFIRGLGKQAIRGDRQLLLAQRKEIDIVVPDHKLGIEFDGLYYHSFDRKETAVEIGYHREKTELMNALGYDLIHIFENEWADETKQKIVKSRILNKLGLATKIHARKCQIREVDKTTCDIFTQANHLQGKCTYKKAYALEHDGQIVSVMTFGKSRYNKKYTWELLRFASLTNHAIVGGASKLFHRFEQENSGSVISYADRRFGQGNIYKELGFRFSHNTKPNYFYIYQNKLHTRISFQKHKLPEKLKVFDPDLSESQNMFNNGYRRIWDCGHSVWLK